MPDVSNGESGIGLRSYYAKNSDALLVALLNLIGLGLFAGIQFSSPAFADIDSYYHTKAAWLILQGQLTPFRWLPLTILGPSEYVDHHFLFHVFLVPFMAQSLLLGGKWAAVACGTLALAAFQAVLPPLKAIERIAAFLLFFAASNGFLYRMSMVRAQSLSLLLLLLAWFAVSQKRYYLLGSISFLYVWTYNAFPLLLLLAGCVAGANICVERRLLPKTLVAVGLGIGLGTVVNPFFPQNIYFLWHHLSDKFNFSGYAVKVGGEWYPYSLDALIANAGVPLLLHLATALLVIRNRRRVSVATLSLHALSWATLAMLLRSKRFIELFPPIAVLSICWTCAELLEGTSRKRAFAAMCVLGVVALPNALSDARNDMRGSVAYERYAETAHQLANYSKPGDLVWTTDWDDFPRLFHFNHVSSYLVGLDPDFLYAKHPGLFNLWAAMTRGELSSQLGQRIHACFGARFVFIDDAHTKLKAQLESDSDILKLFQGTDSAIYEVCSLGSSCDTRTNVANFCSS